MEKEVVLITAASIAILCIFGLRMAAREGREKLVAEKSELHDLVQRLFPDASLTLLPLSRGSFAAIIRFGNVEYVLSGDYLEEEGGDGYMHAREKIAGSERELFRINLRSHKSYMDILTEGILRLSATSVKEPNQSPPTRPSESRGESYTSA